MAILLYAVMYLLLIKTVSSRNISLSTIRYKFTTCGQVGRNGPSFEMCQQAYKDTSLSATTNFFFHDSDAFRSAQRFRIIKTARYNISVAGASGGRGICNIHYGLGLSWRGQIDFTEGDELLILVGQQGTSPCKLSTFPGKSEEICLNPPTTVSEAAVCNSTWFSNLKTVFPDSGDFEFAVQGLGGGGGGGASMIRMFNSSLHIREDPAMFPMIVAPGGGGSAAVTVYEIINQIESTFPDNLTLVEKYVTYLNAKHELFDIDDELGFGFRGHIRDSSSPFRTGAGGGYFSLRSFANVDGAYLGTKDNFAEGGFDCTRQLFDLGPIEPVGVHGGFGAGGGQCGGGGSGGGFSGGRATGANNLYPGQGGFYYTIGAASIDEQDSRNLNETVIGFNDGDGFVEIIEANCGCTGLCEVYREMDLFECHCMENNTNIAPNGFDCTRDIVIEWNKTADNSPQEFISFGQTYGLYSLRASVRIEQNTSYCAIVLMSEDGLPIAATNTLRVNGEFKEISLLQYGPEDSPSLVTSQPYLLEAVQVSGALLLAQGHCELVSNITLTVSTNVRNISKDEVHFINLLVDNSPNLIPALTEAIFGLVEPTNSSVTTQIISVFDGNKDLFTALITVACFAIVFVFCGVLIVSLRCLYIQIKRNKHGTFEDSSGSVRSIFLASTSSMIPNAYYHAFRHSRKQSNTAINYSPAHPPRRIRDSNSTSQGYEVVNFPSNPISSSARYFPTKFGVNAPIHDFSQYNRHRVGDNGHLWEYPRSRLVYLRELGEGQFGKVLLMKAQGIAGFHGELPVAVKTLSSRAPNMLEKFIVETNLMKRFCHPNIISLLGVSSHDVNEDSAPLMILEYMPYGDLHGFLNNNRPEDGISMITPPHFFSIGRDVAEGLNFLAEHRYVHRDVAARNCLVGPDLSIKIADFGLSRKIQSTDDFYKVQGQSVLPIRWMAPESLLHGIFSTSSDVWSYGVLLWEVVTFGELPFERVSAEDIIDMAENKRLIHPRPPNCPEEIHLVMSSCHNQDHTHRPDFNEILKNLSKENIEDYFEQSQII